MTTVHVYPADTGGLPEGVQIDRADELLVAGFNWTIMKNGYVGAWRGNMHLYLHRLIVGAGPSQHVDHRNGDKLDNRRGNLRVASKSQNGANRPKDNITRGATSHYKGVSWKSGRNRWVAHIHVEGRTQYLGSFTNEDDAARAYNMAAVATWGEFARLNVIEGEESHMARDAS